MMWKEASINKLVEGSSAIASQKEIVFFSEAEFFVNALKFYVLFVHFLIGDQKIHRYGAFFFSVLSLKFSHQ